MPEAAKPPLTSTIGRLSPMASDFMVRPGMQRPFPAFCMRAARRVLPSLKWNEHSDFQTRYYRHFEDGCLKNLAWLPFHFIPA